MSAHPITMETVACLLGYPKPATHRRHVCSYEWTGEYEDGEGVVRCPVCGDSDVDATITPPEGSCPMCGGRVCEYDEVDTGIGNSPNTTGFMVLACEDCDREVERKWVGR